MMMENTEVGETTNSTYNACVILIHPKLQSINVSFAHIFWHLIHFDGVNKAN